MTGRDLLEAMAYVEEKYVDEAENVVISRPNLRRFVALAACLCVLLGGAALWMGLPGVDTFKATSSECANGSADLSQEVVADQESPETASVSLILRVESWTEAGFTATVAETGDWEAFPVGMELRVVMESDARENADTTQFDFKAALSQGTLVRVQPGAFNAETGTITVENVEILEKISPEE